MFFLLPQAPGTQAVHRPACKQNINTHKINISEKNLREGRVKGFSWGGWICRIRQCGCVTTLKTAGWYFAEWTLCCVRKVYLKKTIVRRERNRTMLTHPQSGLAFSRKKEQVIKLYNNLDDYWAKELRSNELHTYILGLHLHDIGKTRRKCQPGAVLGCGWSDAYKGQR